MQREKNIDPGFELFLMYLNFFMDSLPTSGIRAVVIMLIFCVNQDG